MIGQKLFIGMCHSFEAFRLSYKLDTLNNKNLAPVKQLGTILYRRNGNRIK